MKIDRMISIIMILLERKKVSIPELAKTCEVATRTIQRDLDTINQAGVPIVSYPGVGGGVGIMENYRVEKRLFSTADVATLLMALGSVRTTISGDEVANALAKIKGMIPEEQREVIELKASRISIDTSPWMSGRSFNELIDLLGMAMEEHRLVRFSYSDRKLNKSERTVEPYRLILKAMNWYFEGFCLERQDFRFFKLSRMAGVVATDEVFAPRPLPAKPVFQSIFANAGECVLAVLRIKEAALDSFLDLCAPEYIEQESETTWIARVPHFDNEEGHKFLLGFGADCECLAPESLRDHFGSYIERVLAPYTSSAAIENGHEASQSIGYAPYPIDV